MEIVDEICFTCKYRNDNPTESPCAYCSKYDEWKAWKPEIVEALRHALEYYANKENYRVDRDIKSTDIDEDAGETARDALEALRKWEEE
jgi:transposase-like protein